MLLLLHAMLMLLLKLKIRIMMTQILVRTLIPVKVEKISSKYLNKRSRKLKLTQGFKKNF